MRHKDELGNGALTMVVPGHAPAAQQQEALVVQMQALLSEFERNIEGSGPLVEGHAAANLRRAMHGMCGQMREGLSHLFEQSIQLEKAAVRQRRASSPQDSPRDREKVPSGLRPELWPKA